MKFVKLVVLALAVIAATLPDTSEARCRRNRRCKSCCASACAPCNGGGCTTNGAAPSGSETPAPAPPAA